MRLTDTDKLYKKLSPQQAAILAFEANIRRDDKEMEAITNSQPQLYFVGASEAYRRRLTGLCNLALCFSSMRWKTRAQMIQSAYSYNQTGVDKALKQLGSMEAALADACGQLGVDLALIRKFAMCDNDDTFIESAEATTMAEYVEIFISLAH